MKNNIDVFIKSLSICREVSNNHAQEKKKCLRGNHSEEYWREEGWGINSLKVQKKNTLTEMLQEPIKYNWI